MSVTLKYKAAVSQADFFHSFVDVHVNDMDRNKAPVGSGLRPLSMGLTLISSHYPRRKKNHLSHFSFGRILLFFFVPGATNLTWNFPNTCPITTGV